MPLELLNCLVINCPKGYQSYISSIHLYIYLSVYLGDPLLGVADFEAALELVDGVLDPLVEISEASESFSPSPLS